MTDAISNNVSTQQADRTPPPVAGALHIDDYLRLVSAEGPFELIDGERIPRMPTGWIHMFLLDTLLDLLKDHVRANDLGRVFAEGTFIQTLSTDWVKGSRIPDIMFYERERLAQAKTTLTTADPRPLALVPDLVVEVLSPTDPIGRVRDGVQRYLDQGVRLVWLVDGDQRRVDVYAGHPVPTILHGDAAVLSGGDVLPGFETTLGVIFAELNPGNPDDENANEA